MTFYQKELQRLKHSIFRNQGQLDTVIAMRSYMDTNYEQELNLELLSKLLLVSKFHLLRLFKKYYGQTPRQYLIDRRISAARQHLEDGMPVTETCFAVGFESLGSFSVLFKKRYGKSPYSYQKEQFSRSNP